MHFSSVLYGQNSISIINPPTSVAVGQTINLDIDYTSIADSVYVLVRFKSPSGANLDQDFKLVKGANGSEPLSITAPSAPGDGYFMQAQLLRVSDWGGLAQDLSDGIIVDVGDGYDLSRSSLENSISIINPPTSVAVGQTINLNIAYTSIADSVNVLVRFKSPSGDNLEQDFRLVGINNGTVPLSITAPVTAGEGYMIQAQLLKLHDDWGWLASQVINEVTVVTDGPPRSGENSVAIIDPPTSVTTDQLVNLNIAYTSKADSVNVLVRFKSPSGDNLDENFKLVGKTNGTVPLSITAPSVVGDGYSIQAQLLSSSDSVELATVVFEGVTVDTPLMTEIDNVSLTDWPEAVEIGGNYEVSVEFAVSQNSVIYVQLFDRESPDGNGNWTKVGSGSAEVTPDSSTATISNIFIDRDISASNRLEVLLFHPVDGTWGAPLDIGDVSVNVAGLRGEIFGEQDDSDPEGTRYYNRSDEGRFYNGGVSGPLSGFDRTLAPKEKVNRQNFWVNNSWKGPIKAYYGEDSENGQNFWVEWQNLGTVFNGRHAEFDIRVEKSTYSDNADKAGFPSKLEDLIGPLVTKSTGRFTEGSSGRCQLNMTAWIYDSGSENAPSQPNVNRCDIIVEHWNNSGDFKEKYKINFAYPSPNPDSNKVTYFDYIGVTTSNNGIVYDVLRTMPGGFGEGASYNLIPVEWSRDFNPGEFETSTISGDIDMNKILKDIISLEEENGEEEILGKDGSYLPTPQLPTKDWYLHVMEWTVTGQSGGFEHDPTSSNFNDKVYIPNSSGRFTYENYTIPNPCSINQTKPCPPNFSNEEEVEDLNEFRFSPNPFTDSFEYEYNVEQNDVVSAELLTLSGRKVKDIKNSVNHSPGKYTDEIDTSDLVAGVYILYISWSDGDKSIKLIKN